MSPNVILYTRSGCHLCEEVEPVARTLCAELALAFRVVDIDQDAELRARFDSCVPVVVVGGEARLKGRIAPAWLERELRAAARADVETFRVGVAVVFDDDGRVLVNKRPEESYCGGWWEWPGGKCRVGESPAECALRELREEIGIEAQSLTLFERRRAAYPGRVVKLSFFTGRLVAGSRAHDGALEHCWLPLEELRRLRFLEQNLPVLERLIAAHLTRGRDGGF